LAEKWVKHVKTFIAEPEPNKRKMFDATVAAYGIATVLDKWMSVLTGA
jgi:hypothetical protein